MSDNHIVIRAEDDSIISYLMKYIEEEKSFLIRELSGGLITGDNDRAAIIAAGRIFELDRVVHALQEAIEEQTKGDSHERSPTYFTS